ncbi:tRNA pseudouridine(38-40) synthase TruA [Candidatus Omnitrophota bacterium]
MARNISLTIEYDGTRFCGWQRQHRRGSSQGRRKVKDRRLKTIQEEIEKAGTRLFKKRIRLIGAGRTDSGVHAEAQIANLKIDTNLPLINIKRGLNSYLPGDIVILSAEDVASHFHARFDAKEKLYRYAILNRKERSPLLKRHTAFVSYDLDIDAMKKAARRLVGKKDFKSFQASDKKEKNSVRTIKKLYIVERRPVVEIYIQADGFLYNMVRNIVGTLIDVGRGRMQAQAIRDILSRRYRPAAGQTAPAKGLCLLKVFY